MRMINKKQIKHDKEITLNDYYVDENGCVYNKRGDEYYKLKPYSDGRRGYLKVKLYGYDENNNSIHIDRYVHRIVMETYYPEDIKENVDHIDRDVTNNKISNLKWSDKKNNTKSTSSTIYLQDIQKIYELFYINHNTLTEIYNHFNGIYDKERLTNIIKGKRYVDEYNIWMEMFNENNIYSNTQIDNVLRMYYIENKPYNVIMYETGIHRIEIIKICMGYIYKDNYIKFMSHSNEFND